MYTFFEQALWESRLKSTAVLSLKYNAAWDLHGDVITLMPNFVQNIDYLLEFS